MGKEVEKREMEQHKEYLKKHGLRLSGDKDTLLQRIKEHQEISGGRGEWKYPRSSFVVNCKGDACKGDVVLFTQNVYDKCNGARGPSRGKRTVAGRIVSESYGLAKQQHTFTIEVLWSKGERPLPPLHPLKIKGRNLYKMMTWRQKWIDEEERSRVLMEKHSRGDMARSAREARIMEKEKWKLMGKKARRRRSRDTRILGSGSLDARVADQGQPKPCYGVAAGVPEKLADPENGFRMKNGVPEHLIPKSTKAADFQPTDSIACKRGNSISTSWEISEEEEFMWVMDSRLPDQDVTIISDISRKDSWTPSDPEKLGFENRVRRPQTAHDVVCLSDSESSSDSSSTEQEELENRLSSPWRLQEATSMDELMFSSSNTNSSYAEGNPAIHDGLPSMTSYVSKIVAGPRAGSPHAEVLGLGVISNAPFIPTTGAIDQQKLPSIGPSSSSQQSLLHQASPSSSFPLCYPPSRQLSNATHHDCSQILPPSHQKRHQFSNVQLGNVSKLLSEELSESSGRPQKQNPPLEWNALAPSIRKLRIRPIHSTDYRNFRPTEHK